MTVFEQVIKGYAPQWKELEAREFTTEEKEFLQSCIVHQGTYDRSAQFLGADNKKYFVPIEKSSVQKFADEMHPGAKLDIDRMLFVHMKYIGDNPEVKVKETFKIRYREVQAETPVTDFNNPFGL